MPPKAAKNGAQEPKKKKELPKELCGCGVDTYRPPPKGKKLQTAPVDHASGCNYQRTTCEAYPHLPRCGVCQNPCGHCGGKNRWCPHCYEIRCEHCYTRVVHGWAPPSIDAGPSSSAHIAAGAAGALGKGSVTGRRSTVRFVPNRSASTAGAADGAARGKKSSVSFA